MADPRPPSKPKKSWKDKTGSAVAASAAKTSRQRQIFRLLAVMTVILAVMGFLVFRIRPAPVVYPLPIAIASYSDPRIPINAFAAQDTQPWAAGTYFQQRESNLTALQERDQIEKALKGLKDRGVNETIIVHLSGHVMADEQAELSFLPGNANPDLPASGIRLRAILEDLKACPARRKFVILDTMRPLANPRLGVLANDAAARIEQVLQEVPDDDRAVLCACAPGQVALVSEDLGQSVFGYYLHAGLVGQADGVTDGRPDGRVTVKELAQYVQEQVDRWAKTNRDTRQTPKLYPPDREFELVSTSKQPEDEEDDQEVVARTMPKWLLDQWAKRDLWWRERHPWGQGVYRYTARELRQLETALLRAESEWRGGREEEAVQKELEAFAHGLEAQVKEARKAIPVTPARSLALAAALGDQPDSALEKTISKLLEQAEAEGRGKKLEDQESERKKLLTQFQTQFKGKPFQLAYAVFEVAAKQGTSPERIQFLDSLLRQLQPDENYVETIFLANLADLANTLKTSNQPWPAQIVREAITVVRDGERAAAFDPSGEVGGGAEPRILPWLRADLDSARQSRHVGEVLLFSPGYAAPATAQEYFKKAFALDREIQNSEATLRRAYRLHDEAYALLPGFLPYLMVKAEIGTAEVADWKAAVQATLDLEASLNRGQLGGASGNLVQGLIPKNYDSLNEALDRLKRSFSSERLKEPLDRARRQDAGPLALADLNALLEVPWIPAKERADIYATARKLSARLLKDSLNQKTRPTPLTAAEEDDQGKREQQRALVRAECALQLLRLGGYSGAESLETEKNRVTADAKMGLPVFASQLRKALAEGIAKQLEQPSTDLNRKERLERIENPRKELRAGSRDANQDPSLALLTEQVRAYSAWLGERFAYASRDFPGPKDGKGAEFFANAARAYNVDPYSAVLTVQNEGGAIPTLRDGRRSDKLDLQISARTTGKDGPQLQVLLPDSDWLDVSLDRARLEGGGPWKVSQTIRLRPGAEDASQAPLGYLLQTTVDGRAYHYKIRVQLPEPNNQRLRLLVSQSRDGKEAVGDRITPRPNLEQTFYVLAVNPTQQPRKVVVELAEEDNPALRLRSDVVDLGIGEQKLVPFSSPSPAAAPGVKANKGQEIKKPLLLTLKDANNPAAPAFAERKLNVAIRKPQDYVKADFTFTPGQPNNRLTARVSLLDNQPLLGPDCEVEMQISESLIPQFLKYGQAKRTGTLSAQNREVTLSADNLQFSGFAQRFEGLVGLRVDGCDRAILHQLVFPDAGGEVRSVPRIAPRLEISDYKAFGLANEPFRARVEVDSAADDAVLEVSRATGVKGQFENPQRLSPPRQQQIYLKGSQSDGGLALDSSVQDRRLDLDTKGLLGDWTLRVRLLEAERERAKKELKLTQDATPPTNLEFVSVNAKKTNAAKQFTLTQGGIVTIVATAEDPESKIEKAYFFEGLPVNGNRPPTATKPAALQGEPGDAKRSASEGIRLPTMLAGAVDVTVEFVNGVGKSSFETITLVPGNPNAANNARQKPMISGTVKEGGVPVADITVSLLSTQQRMVEDTAKSNQQGYYEFKDVKDGKYILYCVNPASKRKAEVSIVVRKDPQTRDLNLAVR